MRYLFLLVLFVHYMTCCFCQKPPITSSIYYKWTSVGAPAISNDGKYVLYTIKNQPEKNQTLVMEGTNLSWKMEITGNLNAIFTQDSRYAVFAKSKDSLGIVTLGKSSVEYISNVSSFKLPQKGSGEWLAYQLNNPQKELVVSNLITNKTMSFTM